MIDLRFRELVAVIATKIKIICINRPFSLFEKSQTFHWSEIYKKTSCLENLIDNLRFGELFAVIATKTKIKVRTLIAMYSCLDNKCTAVVTRESGNIEK